MTVCAVIPHWNRRDLLAALLQSLRDQTRSFDEIIVVDNGSSDDSAKLARSAGARVLELGRNCGFAAAVNRGIEAARGDWVAILNNDVTLAPTWLETLLQASGGACFAQGKILSQANPKILDGAFDAISRGACAARCGSGKPDSAFWNEARPIRLASMTAAIFRRELFNGVGMLDERFGSYLEDVDFGLRCAAAGRAGIYIPEAVAYHRGSATLGAWNSDTVRLIARNQILLAVKHFTGMGRWPIVAGQLLWGVLAMRHGRGVAWFSGKLSGMRAAREMRGDYLVREEQGFRAILEASERDIFEIQQQTGFDRYWRAYFWLLRR